MIRALVLLLMLIAAPATACTVPDGAEATRTEVVERTNALRRERGLPALARSPALADAARGHACWMAEGGAFSHTGEAGSDLARRVREAGYRFGFVAENIALGQRDPQEVMRSWMGSAGHRENILAERAREIGVALAVGADGRRRWVMVVGQTL